MKQRLSLKKTTVGEGEKRGKVNGTGGVVGLYSSIRGSDSWGQAGVRGNECTVNLAHLFYGIQSTNTTFGVAQQPECSVGSEVQSTVVWLEYR